MKTKVRTSQYAWSDYGYLSELIIIEFMLDDIGSDFKKLRAVVEAKNRMIDERSYPSHIGGQIDCTGKSFGSDFRKLDFQENQDGYIAVYIHSWSIDI